MKPVKLKLRGSSLACRHPFPGAGGRGWRKGGTNFMVVIFFLKRLPNCLNFRPHQNLNVLLDSSFKRLYWKGA